MIEQGFNYADSTMKEKTDFFETRAENLQPEEDKKKFSVAAKKSHKKSHKKKKGKTSTPVLQSPAKNPPKFAVQARSTVFYTEMQSFYGQLQGSTCYGNQTQAKKEEEFQKLWEEQQRIERSH